MSTILVSGVMTVRSKGEHLGIYNVGTPEEIRSAIWRGASPRYAGRDIDLVALPAPAGGTERRCPDIRELADAVTHRACRWPQGLPPTLDWYWANEGLAVARGTVMRVL